jgi:hypothetical protein
LRDGLFQLLGSVGPNAPDFRNVQKGDRRIGQKDETKLLLARACDLTPMPDQEIALLPDCGPRLAKATVANMQGGSQ